MNAASVSRRLGQQFTRSEYLASGRIRGCGRLTEGFEAKDTRTRRQRRDGEPCTQVKVAYISGSWKDSTRAECREQLLAYKAVLEEYYAVELVGESHLLVTAK